MDIYQRKEAAEEALDMEIEYRKAEILADPELLEEAIGDFGEKFGHLALSLCLSALSQCETPEQYKAQVNALAEHTEAIAQWYAEKTTNPISIFLEPQAS